jgi:hypothetical protein
MVKIKTLTNKAVLHNKPKAAVHPVLLLTDPWGVKKKQ